MESPSCGFDNKLEKKICIECETKLALKYLECNSYITSSGDTIEKFSFF